MRCVQPNKIDRGGARGSPNSVPSHLAAGMSTDLCEGGGLGWAPSWESPMSLPRLSFMIPEIPHKPAGFSQKRCGYEVTK